MKQRLLLGSVTLTLLLGGCASQPESQSATPAAPLPASATSPATVAAPSKTESTAETPLDVPRDNLKFSAGDGEVFQTFEDVQKSVEFRIEDIPARADTISLVVERMEKAANYLLSEKSIRASLNKPTGILSPEDYMLVYDQYLNAHDVMFGVKSGDLYDTLRSACRQTAYNHLISVVEGDEVPYAIKFTLHTNDTGLLISDNSEQNSIDGLGQVGSLDQLGDYQLISADGGRDIVPENGNWYVAGNMELLKKAH